MKFLTVDKAHKIIELAELVQTSRKSQTPGISRYTLSNYVYNLSSEELAEAIALMLLGRGHSGEQPSDFPDLVKEAQGVQAHYLLEKSPLANYLRNGLLKLEFHLTKDTSN